MSLDKKFTIGTVAAAWLLFLYEVLSKQCVSLGNAFGVQICGVPGYILFAAFTLLMGWYLSSLMKKTKSGESTNSES